MHSVIRSNTSFASGGKKIALDCFLPEAGGQRFPAVISLHGFHGGHASMAEPSEALAAEGFAVFVLHYFDRTGPVEANRATLMVHFPVWMKTVWDAISHIAERPDVGLERIGLLGFSLGGYLALCNASIDTRVRAVAECFGGFPKEMKFFMRRFCPVLVLHGEADPIIPVAEAYYVNELASSRRVDCEMHIYPGVGHGFEGDVRQDAAARTLDFFKKYLKGEDFE